MNLQKITGPVRDYYTEKLLSHGATSLGVDWRTEASQYLRFEQVLKICDFQSKFTLIDVGCGYGALASYLGRKKTNFRYLGFDLSEEMIWKARQIYRGQSRVRFKLGMPQAEGADYAVASGIFNVRLKTGLRDWKGYILKVLKTMDRNSRKGFSFNCLTKYSDREKMKSTLYYADPLFFFDYCKRNFSKEVALLHDYGLYEFTLLVRKKL